MEDKLPLMLQTASPETIVYAVKAEVLPGFTLSERLRLGTSLPNHVGLRAEAWLSGMDLHELDLLLTADDVALAASIVRPYLT